MLYLRKLGHCETIFNNLFNYLVSGIRLTRIARKTRLTRTRSIVSVSATQSLYIQYAEPPRVYVPEEPAVASVGDSVR